MIKIKFDEPSDAHWRTWRQKCERATQELLTEVEQGNPCNIKDIYKEQSSVYLSHDGPFHGKCAYCESFIAADQPGDLDHYRPQGRVTDAGGRPIMIPGDVSKSEIAHPGYYWLVYDWRNLLPACADCNRPSKKKTGGQRIGKRDQFPVKNYRASKPGEEAQEEPLLIHPVFQDPERHLEIDYTGIFTFKTPEGETCIEIFGLNIREALVECRKKKYCQTKDQVQLLTGDLFSNPRKAQDRIRALMDIKKEGKEPYAAPGRAAIQKELSPVIRELLSLLNEPPSSNADS